MNKVEKYLIIYKELVLWTNRSYSSLKDEFPGAFASLSRGQKSERTFGHATRFEIFVYLLSRLDMTLYNFRQDQKARAGVYSFCLRNILSEFRDLLREKDLASAANARAQEYARAVTAKKEADIAGAMGSLANFIAAAESMNELETQALKIVLMAIEKECVTTFVISLKHLFQDNKDFTALDANEIYKRIEKGINESARRKK